MRLKQLLNFWLIAFQYCSFSASFLNTSIFSILRQQMLQADLFRKYNVNARKDNEWHSCIVKSLLILQ